MGMVYDAVEMVAEGGEHELLRSEEDAPPTNIDLGSKWENRVLDRCLSAGSGAVPFAPGRFGKTPSPFWERAAAPPRSWSR